MLNLSELAASETIEDTIKFLVTRAPTSSHYIDLFFKKHRKKLTENSEILKATFDLLESEVLSLNEKQLIIKGPAWTAPEFMKQGKYGIATT